MLTKRRFLKITGAAGAGMFLPWKAAVNQAEAAIPGGTLNPLSLPKYVSQLLIPPVMPRQSEINLGSGGKADYYEIAMRQFRQQVLPAGFPTTTVWGYGSPSHPDSFSYPAYTVEAKVNRPVRVKWMNQLMDGAGNYLPHLLPVDPTLHWANPPGPRDMHPMFPKNVKPSRYTGPIPMVVHLHGAHVQEESDGYAEAWFLPPARNIPAGYFTTGTFYDPFKTKSEPLLGQNWEPGSAVFQYDNDQSAATLWYHDHTVGLTRLNVYAGTAGFYLLRGGADDLAPGALPGPAPKPGDAPNTKYYEIPLVIQDRCFNTDGSWFYPDSRLFFDGFKGPYLPKTDIPPIWNPEFFGNTMLVNGRTWPNLNVEPRRYRFRFLDGCGSRTLILKMVTNPLAPRPVTPALPFAQIGSDGGFLPSPVVLNRLLLGPAERADVIVDFTGLPVGTEIYLINEAADEPFGGGEPGEDFEVSDPLTTGQVMKFTVVPLTAPDTSLPVNQLTLPTIARLPAATNVRRVSVNELDSAVLKHVGPLVGLLGTMDSMNNPMPMMWGDPVSETPRLGDTEIWEIYNFTADAHPIHLHQVEFEVVNRQPLVTGPDGLSAPPARFAGPPVPPEPWETGQKDTLLVYPGGVTRIKARFDIRGLYTWHCHIIEHEDNEMMRPYRVI